MSSETLQTLITMLGKTEGRDKLLKAGGGAMAVVATFTGATQHKKMSASFSETRTLMRFWSWLKNIQILATCPKTSTYDCIYVLRVLFDFIYCMHDNLKYLTKYGIISPAPLATIVHRSFIGLFWGFVFAVLMDLHVLMTRKLDAKERKQRFRMLARNTCDVLAGLHHVKYLKGYNLSPRTLGLLGFTSGFISSQDIYNNSRPKN